MPAEFCDYCSSGDCDIDDEECKYNNFTYEDRCHKYRNRKKHDDDDDDSLLGIGLGLAGLALGGSSGFGGFGGGGFGGGGGGGKF